MKSRFHTVYREICRSLGCTTSYVVAELTPTLVRSGMSHFGGAISLFTILHSKFFLIESVRVFQGFFLLRCESTLNLFDIFGGGRCSGRIPRSSKVLRTAWLLVRCSYEIADSLVN